MGSVPVRMNARGKGLTMEEKRFDLLPRAPISRVLDPLHRFLHIESASGVLLLTTTATALVLANSPMAESFLSFWETPVGFRSAGSKRPSPSSTGSTI